MDIMDQLKEQVEQNKVLLYMKGSPNQPQCGFSARVVQSLMACGQRVVLRAAEALTPLTCECTNDEARNRVDRVIQLSNDSLLPVRQTALSDA